MKRLRHRSWDKIEILSRVNIEKFDNLPVLVPIKIQKLYLRELAANIRKYKQQSQRHWTLALSHPYTYIHRRGTRCNDVGFHRFDPE